ncbi:hypothetical protein [Methylobacillus sp.]|uniref:hypothetical protein n=1 Tax=Methylobacillus sp. TaxID=56818 RepID=UPI002FE1E156
MATIKERLKALEQTRTGTLSELPFIVSDTCTDEELKQLQRNGRKVFRESDPELMEEFI